LLLAGMFRQMEQPYSGSIHTSSKNKLDFGGDLDLTELHLLRLSSGHHGDGWREVVDHALFWS
jgi:hypothetical protein